MLGIYIKSHSKSTEYDYLLAIAEDDDSAEYYVFSNSLDDFIIKELEDEYD